MTGYDIYNNAITLLGYMNSDTIVSPKGNKYERTLRIINWILSDLKCKEITSLSEIITVDGSKADAVCTGVAMLLSLSEGDSQKNKAFTDIYNGKRATVLSEIKYVGDKIPTVTG